MKESGSLEMLTLPDQHNISLILMVFILSHLGECQRFISCVLNVRVRSAYRVFVYLGGC
jgi:hypothetical protein